MSIRALFSRNFNYLNFLSCSDNRPPDSKYFYRPGLYLPGLAALLLLFSSGPLMADIYRWTDEQGKLHYSDSAVEGAVLVELEPLPISHDSEQERIRKQDNAQWFKQRHKQRLAEAKEKLKTYKKTKQKRKKAKRACAKARNKLADKQLELSTRKRQGKGITVAKENNYKVKIALLEAKAERVCS